MNKEIYKRLEKLIPETDSFGAFEDTNQKAVFTIFDEYISKILDDKLNVKDKDIEFIGFFGNGQYLTTNTIDTGSTINGGITAIFKVFGVDCTINFREVIQNREIYHSIKFSPKKKNKYGLFLYKYLFESALINSTLKGSYFTMPRDMYSWNIKNLEVRTFDDIFLPETLMDDLKMYVNVYKKTDRLMRFLKVGNPGTGKTESGLVLANELNKAGVTVIKTPICGELHKKVELAKTLSPSIIIFDDIDLYLGNRDSGGFSSLLGDFLDVLDGTDKLSSNVGIIATTNAANLLDLAAQRPGRFDKILLFDNITEDNVSKIINKSFTSNFPDGNEKDLNKFTNERVIKTLYDSGVSGSHIYNMVKMLKLRYDSLEMEYDVDKIIKSIKMELSVVDKVRKATYLKEKYDRDSGGIGFNTSKSVERKELR
jgi:DNA polymerase III delta prime subunit